MQHPTAWPTVDILQPLMSRILCVRSTCHPCMPFKSRLFTKINKIITFLSSIIRPRNVPRGTLSDKRHSHMWTEISTHQLTAKPKLAPGADGA